MDHAGSVCLCYSHDHAFRHGGDCRQTQRLSGQAPFPKEIAGFQKRDHGFLSLTYLTVVGEAIIRGENNDTQTMMDAVVYDIQSRKLLFRAPGTSQVKASATPLYQDVDLRANAGTGLQIAATNLVSNLQEQLALFKDQVKSSPEEYKIVTKPGYTGGGSLGGLEVALVAGLGLYAAFTRKPARQ